MSSAAQRLQSVNDRLVGLFKADSKTMMSFKSLSEAATREGAVSPTMKELIAVAIAAARGCDDCVLYHVAEAKKHGADRSTLVEVLAVSVEMSGGPGAVYAAKALAVYDEL